MQVAMKGANMWHVVTGSSGFIGGNLVRTLLARGRSVRAVDVRPSSSIEVLHAGYGDRLETIRGDLVDATIAEAAVDRAAVVYHLAAETNLAKSVAAPGNSLADDLLTTIRILEAARECDTKPRVVFASSASVYGGSERSPLSEGDVGCGLLTPYGVHKRASELYCEMYARLHGVPAVCARFFNVYGPGQMSLQACVPAFVTAMLRGQEVTVHGDGSHVRDFVHVSDVVDALILMSSRNETGEYNVGTGTESSIADLIQSLESIAGEQMRVKHGPAMEFDIQKSRADVSKIARLGWEPKTCLRDGLVDTIEFYRGIA
jgi:UDP-glucose 4-epimerase